MLGKGEGSQFVGFGLRARGEWGEWGRLEEGIGRGRGKGVGLTAEGAGEGGVRPVANVRCAVAEEVEVKEGEGELEGAEGEGVGDEWHVGVGGRGSVGRLGGSVGWLRGFVSCFSGGCWVVVFLLLVLRYGRVDWGKVGLGWFVLLWGRGGIQSGKVLR